VNCGNAATPLVGWPLSLVRDLCCGPGRVPGGVRSSSVVVCDRPSASTMSADLRLGGPEKPEAGLLHALAPWKGVSR